ncbi:MAG: HAMP domain-containing protein [Leptospiraceae bacterium]|nr:HAMP domain-containing protein [Leptospiraceae bacterium]MCZ8345264.1 HAMP domain-containing protein [Leptospiraceae bacterium]
MSAIRNYNHLGSSGSVIYLEPINHSFSASEAEKRRILYSTQFLGKKIIQEQSFYHFGAPSSSQNILDSLQFSFPDPNGFDSIADIKLLSQELIKKLNGSNLVIFYHSEEEEKINEILYLIRLGSSPFEIDDTNTPEIIFEKPSKEWKQAFIQFGFNMFRQKLEKTSFAEIEIIYNLEKKKKEKQDDKNENDAISKSTIVENKTESRAEDHVLNQKPSTQETKVSSNIPIEPPILPLEPSIVPKEVSKQPQIKEVESKIEAVNLKKTEEVKKQETPVNNSEKTNAKFSIQIKMMGMISLILAVTVSTIIAIATYFFKDDSIIRIQENNLNLVGVIGLKVSSDIQSIVSKAEQLVEGNRKNISDSEKKFVTDLFFKNDKDFIFVGVFNSQDGTLNNETSYYNEDYLIEVAISEEEVKKAISINTENILKAINGTPVILNSTPGFSKPSFLLALPANIDTSTPRLFVILVRLDKISPAFNNKGINTTFMVNGEGKAIAHPIEEVVLSAGNFIDLPIVKEMLTSQVESGLKRFENSEGKAFLGSYRRLGFGDAGIISIVSEEKALQAVYKIQETNLYIMGISLCLAMIIVFFFAKSLSRPILSLLSATLEIAKGNFNIGIKPTTKDEVGLLTSYFVTMGEGLEEREKVKSILGSMIDPVVVKEAMVDMEALKRGKEAEITAFFSDVAGFSTISEQLTSVELAALLNEYLSAMTILLKENEGVLDKYIGDAIVGIFGAPVIVDNHAIKACKASLEMVMKLEDLRLYWQKNNLYSKEAQVMDARIGLNTGLAKVGFMGTDALASYTMMGDTVNLAARLEAAGKDYGVNVMIAEATKNLVEDEMFLRFLDLVRVKGKNEPVKVYELVAFRHSVAQNIADSVGLYQEGFDLYLKKNWDGAIKKFQASELAKGKKDKSAHMLIARCQDYKISPPPKDWDGVFTRTTK